MLKEVIATLILIALWLTVIAICLFTMFLMVSIGINLWSEYVIKVRLKAELLKKEIDRVRDGRL